MPGESWVFSFITTVSLILGVPGTRFLETLSRLCLHGILVYLVLQTEYFLYSYCRMTWRFQQRTSYSWDIMSLELNCKKAWHRTTVTAASCYEYQVPRYCPCYVGTIPLMHLPRRYEVLRRSAIHGDHGVFFFFHFISYDVRRTSYD